MSRYIKVTENFANWLIEMAISLFNNGVRGDLNPRAPLPGGDHQANNPLEHIPDDAFPPGGKREFIINFISFCRYIAVVLYHKVSYEMHDDMLEGPSNIIDDAASDAAVAPDL
jgi:hypothetical protein